MQNLARHVLWLYGIIAGLALREALIRVVPVVLHPFNPPEHAAGNMWAVPVEGAEGLEAQGEGNGEGGRRRDGRPRRRSRGNAEGNGVGNEGNADPGNAPQPEVNLPAFLTAGGPAAE